MTALRIVATSDLGAATVPLRTSYGLSGTCAGVELRPGELRAAADAYWATADPRNETGDHLSWNWCRMPAGTSVGPGEPHAVAIIPGVVEHLCDWLGRDVEAQPSGVSARDALVRALDG